MIFRVTDTRRAQKLTRRAVYATASARKEFLEGSDSTIIFDHTEHLAYIPHPGKFTLVLDPIVDGFRLPRVLMDGSCGVNVIFPDTLAKMGISKSRLSPLPIGFHGFVLGKKVQPLGQISLEVVFGTKKTSVRKHYASRSHRSIQATALPSTGPHT